MNLICNTCWEIAFYLHTGDSELPWLYLFPGVPSHRSIMALGFLTSHLRTLKNLDMRDIRFEKVLGLMSSKVTSDDEDYSHITQRKTKCQLILLSAAVCGIEFCYSAETAFVTPILLKIGVPVYYMTLIWCLSPLLGFFMMPILGSLSDRCKWRLGRRRPFILLFSLGVIIGLILVPNGEDIGKLCGDKFGPDEVANINDSVGNETGIYVRYGASLDDDMYPVEPSYITETFTNVVATTVSAVVQSTPHVWSIFFTVVGVALLDFSCDSCQSPCRAYMLDVTVPADHSAGLSTFTVLAGFGGALGYTVGGINFGGTPLGASIGGHIKVVFTLVLFIYLICVLLTVTSIREVPLGKLGIPKSELQPKKKKHEGEKYKRFVDEDDSDDIKSSASINRLDPQQQGYGTCDEIVRARSEGDIMQMKQLNHNGLTTQDRISVIEDDHHLPQEENNATKPGCSLDMEPGRPGETHEGPPLASEISLKTYLMSIIHLPKSIALLCLTNLFCWMSLVCYSLYFTDFVGQAVYGGDPSAPKSSEAHLLYDEGVRTGSLAMALYSLSCSVYSLSIEKLVNMFG